jgi:hypothetical protein
MRQAQPVLSRFGPRWSGRHEAQNNKSGTLYALLIRQGAHHAYSMMKQGSAYIKSGDTFVRRCLPLPALKDEIGCLALPSGSLPSSRTSPTSWPR